MRLRQGVRAACRALVKTMIVFIIKQRENALASGAESPWSRR
jgi:hypothetical protein